MNIHIILVTYAIDPTSLVTALQGDDVTWWVFHHSKRVDVADACYALQNSVPIHFYDYRENRGLATSWNDGLIAAYAQNADCVILANDDLTIARADLDKLAAGCVEHRECGLIVCQGWNERMNDRLDLGYSLIGVNPLAIDTLGYFDENIVPYTYEDCDYSRRAALAGLKFYSIGDTGIVHVGSATVALDAALRAQHDVAVRATRAYYLRKWNGEPGSEVYTVPFNDTHFGLKIDGHLRHAPYEGYNRTDIGEIVRL